MRNLHRGKWLLAIVVNARKAPRSCIVKMAQDCSEHRTRYNWTSGKLSPTATRTKGVHQSMRQPASCSLIGNNHHCPASLVQTGRSKPSVIRYAQRDGTVDNAVKPPESYQAKCWYIRQNNPEKRKGSLPISWPLLVSLCITAMTLLHNLLSPK